MRTPDVSLLVELGRGITQRLREVAADERVPIDVTDGLAKVADAFDDTLKMVTVLAAALRDKEAALRDEEGET